METTTFTCAICGESSHDICVFCTKDACANHLCERCRRCSDCCECEVRLTEPESIHHVLLNGAVDSDNADTAREAQVLLD